MLLPARKLRRTPREEVLDAQELRDSVDARRARTRALLAHAQRVLDVVSDRHVRVQRVALEHESDIAVLWFERDHAFAIDPDVAAVELLEAGEHPERRRLAAAARAEQDEELAVGDVEGQALHRGRIARRELLPDVVVLDA